MKGAVAGACAQQSRRRRHTWRSEGMPGGMSWRDRASASMYRFLRHCTGSTSVRPEGAGRAGCAEAEAVLSWPLQSRPTARRAAARGATCGMPRLPPARTAHLQRPARPAGPPPTGPGPPGAARSGSWRRPVGREVPVAPHSAAACCAGQRPHPHPHACSHADSPRLPPAQCWPPPASALCHAPPAQGATQARRHTHRPAPLVPRQPPCPAGPDCGCVGVRGRERVCAGSALRGGQGVGRATEQG